MPGIVGIIGKGEGNATDVAAMTRRLIHESFYVSGTHVCDDMNVSLGWTAHPKSYAAEMPLWSPDRNVMMLFSGEHFDDTSANQADARALLARYDAMGVDFLTTLNGWFSGVLIDFRKRCGWLFNDRYGLGRIYYRHAKGRLYFASEAKALLEVLPDTRELDPQGVAETVACGSVLQNRTLFRNVALLPSGAAWAFQDDGRIVEGGYFDRAIWERQSPLGAGEFYERLEETISRVVPRYFGGESQMAMSLTGGIDGRMILAAAQMKDGALPCFTFGGPYRDCADVVIARRLAALCGQSHQTIGVSQDFFRDFPALAEKTVLISDGAMDVTGAVELYMNRLAREIAPVRMTGNYGSEVIRGNVAFRPTKISTHLFESDFANLIDAATRTYEAEKAIPTQSFIAFKQAPWHHYSRLAIEQSQLTLRSPYFDNDLVALMYRVPQELQTSSDMSLRLVGDLCPSMAKIPTDRGEIRGAQSIFRRLEKQWIDFTVKAEYAYDYGMPGALAKLDHRLRPLHFEKLFLGRHKFYHFRVWYRDQLARYVREILLDPRALQRPYLKGDVLQRMVKAHTEGRENWTREIHRVLTLELLQRQAIDG